MQRTATLVLLLLTLATAPARAQGGINLSWDGCTQDPGASTESLTTFACNTSSGPAFVLFASVIVPANMPKFAAASLVIDVLIRERETLPAWWQTARGECRANAMTLSFDPAVLVTQCADLWAGVPNLSTFSLQRGVHGLANELRINGGAAIPAGQEIAVLADGAELNVATLSISRAKTVGTDACEGCANCAMIVLNDIKLLQPVPLPAFAVSNPATSNIAWWNGSCPPSATVNNRSWGQIKGLYR